MLKNKFDPQAKMRFVRYGRMSSDKQNPRSPEQQFITIDETLRRLGYPWLHVADYRDDSISGRYFRKRPGLQKLLAEIRSGRLQVDAILVDTYERFGRDEQFKTLRRTLFQKYGVLLMTADSNFADPNSVSGQALAFVESFRSTEENRIKAHNVLRGKRDAVRQGKWPGGSPPLGYKLESVLQEVNGRQEVAYSKLVPDPLTAWIIVLLFDKALESGWGATRLAKYLNAHPDIPENLKPFDQTCVSIWLKSRTYIGEYTWERSNTGIVDDRRVSQSTSPEERIVVHDFCEPLITREVFEGVQQMRLARALKIRRKAVADITDATKAVLPITQGVALKYSLSGLVRCGKCGRAMTANSSGAYITAAGEERRYCGYICPGYLSGSCTNGRRVPEEWLRKVVVDLLLGHVFFPGEDTPS